MEAAGQGMPTQKPILEINPTHPLVTRLSVAGRPRGVQGISLAVVG
jgi:HSP90 family molecular chaperone